MGKESQKKRVEKQTAQQRGLFDRDLGSDGLSWKGLLRYGWDLAGVLVFSAALILLLGVTGITKGVVITPISLLLSRWLGVGRFAIVIVMIIAGVYLLRWRKHPPERIALGRIIALELSVFLILAILSMVSGHSLAKAEAGLDLGGLVGWGIAELLNMIVGSVLTVILLLIFLCIAIVSTFNLIPKFEKAIQKDWVKFQRAKQETWFQSGPTLRWWFLKLR